MGAGLATSSKLDEYNNSVREQTFLDWLQRHQGTHPALAVGIGDDAAVLRASDRELVVTTDLICDGVHFECEHSPLRQIGRKAMAVNLSDIAAMAAWPVAAFVSLLLPRELSAADTTTLMEAMSELAGQFDCVVAGGDTNVWAGRLAVNVTLLGKTSVHGPLRRSGAKPGDVLMVTGALGGSLGGHHFDFVPRIREASLLHEKFDLHAGMDISDGLALDLRRMAAASGCGAEIDAAAVPISQSVREMTDDPAAQLRHALGDGEDFELLIAAAPEQAALILQEQPLDVPATAIGRCLPKDEGMCLMTEQGRVPLPSYGYEHGRLDEREPT